MSFEGRFLCVRRRSARRLTASHIPSFSSDVRRWRNFRHLCGLRGGKLRPASPKASRLVAVTRRRIRCVAVVSGPSMLIRPDACIAWAVEERFTDGFEETFRRWTKAE